MVGGEKRLIAILLKGINGPLTVEGKQFNWRRLGVALATTAVFAALTAVVAPTLWPKWIDYVLETGVSPDVGAAFWVPIALLVRLPVAALLVIWGARTNRPWTLPTASMLALPVLWLVGLAMLAGAFALSPWGPLKDFGRRWSSVPASK